MRPGNFQNYHKRGRPPTDSTRRQGRGPECQKLGGSLEGIKKKRGGKEFDWGDEIIGSWGSGFKDISIQGAKNLK